MAYAVANDYVVFTHDLDFGMILATRRATGPSVVQIRTQDVLPATIGEVVISAIRASQDALMQGSLVTLDPRRRRVRILPI
jgi:predicted nuclease of predicted toxin-antitoxin system